jgi:hypothetical protein
MLSLRLLKSGARRDDTPLGEPRGGVRATRGCAGGGPPSRFGDHGGTELLGATIVGRPSDDR